MQIKYDGSRTIIFKHKDEVWIIGKSWAKCYNDYFPELVKEVLKIKAEECILDTELTWFDEKGKDKFLTVFATEEGKKKKGVVIARAMTFDILSYNNKDTTDLPIEERLRILKDIIPENLNHIKRVISYPASIELHNKIINAGYEGTVIKRRHSKYERGKVRSWLKIRKLSTEDCVVIGCTNGNGERSLTFGAFILCQYDDKGKLVYVSKASSGLDFNKLCYFLDKMSKLEVERCPANYGEMPFLDVKMWCKPEIVVEIKYANRTDNNRLRKPVFVRERLDKPFEDCVLP